MQKAVKNVLDCQLLDIKDITKAFGVLIHVSGDEDLNLEGVCNVGKLVKRTISPEFWIIWGTKVNPGMLGPAYVFIFLTWLESAFLSQLRTKPLFKLF